jgi:hypothetical protein
MYCNNSPGIKNIWLNYCIYIVIKTMIENNEYKQKF